MRFEFPVPVYNASGEGKCREMFHPEIQDGPYCGRDLEHDDKHEGHGLRWAEEPQVDAEIARRFLKAYRRIPNHFHEIELQHDGTVSMALSALEAAVRFIDVMPSSD